MRSFEQRIEPANAAWQYLVVAAEPYETIAFKLQSREIDRTESIMLEGVPEPVQRNESGTWSYWDDDSKTYSA